MTRFILSDEAQIILTDRSTGDTATTTKYAAREVITGWYGAGIAVDPVVADEMDKVIAAIESNSDLSGSDYLGLSIELAD